MSLAETDHVAPTPAIARTGVLEVDAFCVGCHYNLHGQVVTVDERLGIAVCRCPECGRFHPAGSGVTASSVWLRRFATLLLFVWVLIVLMVATAGFFAIAGISHSSVAGYSDYRQVSQNGKPVVLGMVNGVQTWVEEGTKIPATNIHSEISLTQFFTLHDADGTLNLGTPILCAVSVFIGFILGTLVVTLFWHWPRGRYFWCLLIPLMPAGFLSLIYSQNSGYEMIRAQIAGRIAGQTGLQCFGILLGVLVGRKVSRTVVRMLVPPKARQLLAFLWTVDGKAMPAVMAKGMS
jgi:hypothetical protein